MTDKKQTLKEQIDAAAGLLLQKSMGNVTLPTKEAEQSSLLLAEHIKAFSAVVEWYKIRGGAAADEKPQESKFDSIKHRFRDADSAPGKRRRGSAKSGQAAAGEPADASEPDGDDE